MCANPSVACINGTYGVLLGLSLSTFTLRAPEKAIIWYNAKIGTLGKEMRIHRPSFGHAHIQLDAENTIQYITVQYNTVQYSTVQHSTAQHSTIQYNTFSSVLSIILR